MTPNELDSITECIPKTFYSGLPIAKRVKILVDQWQRAIRVNKELELKFENFLDELPTSSNTDPIELLRALVHERDLLLAVHKDLVKELNDEISLRRGY